MERLSIIAWLAERKNKAGLMMPGTILVGDKYYQEIAPHIAMYRTEIISSMEKFKTKAGSWEIV